MSKVFKVDEFTITLEDELVQKAIDCYALEDEKEEDGTYGNYLHIKNLIKAMCTPTIEDIGTISYEYIRAHYTDEELSEKVKVGLLSIMKTYGSEYRG